MTLRSRTRARIALVRAGNDRGLLSMVMMVVIIGMGLGALLVPMIVTQSRSTLHTDTRVQALHAAEAGIDAMLGQVRPAIGLATNLRCYDGTTGAPALTGAVAGSTTTSYSVTLQYFASDPRAPLTTGLLPIAMGCSAGGTATSVPSFARITSAGTDSAGGRTSTRTLATTYAFNTTNATTNGGQIRLYTLPANAVPMCMDAGLIPAAGTAVSMQACVTPATPAQAFSYNADLSVQLLSSITAALPYGLCVDSVVPHVDGNPVTLQPCLAPGSAAYNQRWSLNDVDEFVGTKSDLSADSFCLAAPDPSVAKPVLVKTCAGGTNSNVKDSWVPTPSVGAGAAGAANGQLVNFSQVDRCADVTNQGALTLPNPFMILYPCKQDTRPAMVDWSQKFAYSASTQRWVTTTNSTDYCLTSTGTATGYVTVTACDVSNTRQKWTEFGVTLADQANAGQWSYTVRYTIVDSTGLLCLSLSPISGTGADWFTPTGTSRQYSKLTSDTCDGSTRQKWNADPGTQSPVLHNTTEK